MLAAVDNSSNAVEWALGEMINQPDIFDKACRNPRVWEDPLVYKPECHIINKDTEVVFVDHELRMLSFSTGRRGCPVVVLASTMTVILLARFIHSFNWSAPLDASNNTVDLTESKEDLSMAKPLIAHAIPSYPSRVKDAFEVLPYLMRAHFESQTFCLKQMLEVQDGGLEHPRG
ncbi:Phenylalanine N-monooxygenase CYP79D16 [Sesamum angolense]|uniref:Phenylalanine N-monooxygenase CYP79D16 n=1 Tax=Sesamum angolense TaxID=2727404 RepID=A0AAE2BKA6_9LAMI|nr:Phenylalanine N-monooxygenase CYP79D16 [Sesamum angolense]